MGVSDGQAVDAANTNPAFLDQNQDDTMHGILGMDNAQPASGAPIGNVQGSLNHLLSTTGATETADGTTYTSQKRIANGQDHVEALSALDTGFHESTGHKHTGVAGDAPPIAGTSVSGVPLRGVFVQASDLAGITGTTTNVSGLFGAETPSSGPTVQGVVVTAPNNKLFIRKAGGTDSDDVYKDANGNVVYGRLTEAAGVWTLSYFVDLAGIETAYNFTVASDIRWYYQKLYNPMSNSPVYSELASIPSDNATADVIDATASLKGKVSTPVSAATEVGSTGTGGTANAQAAAYDHQHKGLHSLAKSAGDTTQLFGDVTLEEGSGCTITRTGNKLTFAFGGGAGQDESIAELTVADSPYVPDFTKQVLFVDTSGGDVAINPGAIGGNLGKRLRIKKVSTDGNKITFTPNAADDVDGAASIEISDPKGAVTMITRTNQWAIFA